MASGIDKGGDHFPRSGDRDSFYGAHRVVLREKGEMRKE